MGRFHTTQRCLAKGLLSWALLHGLAQAPAQAPPDEQAAFDAARAVTAPAPRAAALELYLRTFPGGTRSASAQQLLLDTYLEAFPDRTAAIHALASAMVEKTSPGLERWTEEARVADQLAGAHDGGADLADASLWAGDAVHAMTEAAYRQQMIAAQARYKLPALGPRQLHAQFAHDRAACLLALAHVDIAQNHITEARTNLAEAARLDPNSGEGYRLQGEAALSQGNRQEALDRFLHANAVAALPSSDRQQELALFQELEHGDENALEARIDEVYRALYPRPYALPPRQLPPGGHPALLELFTGSDCVPCAGPDLALESLLGSYSRKDLIALEWDEHIPRPDPLATPDTASRAGFYGIESTPSAFLDGKPLAILGSSRQDVENIVIGFADQLEDQAALPSGLQLTLATARTGTDGIRLEVKLALAPVAAAPTQSTTGDTSFRALQRAVVNVALVQDDLRYSGANGVRLHRMVVRALHQAPAAMYLGATAATNPITFEPAKVEQQLVTYLADYEQHNDRFGAFHFPVTNIPLRADHLALVVWVQDAATRQVLQSGFLPTP